MASARFKGRGQLQLSEFMVKQQEQETKKKEVLWKQLKDKWTPLEIQEQCCLEWLALGPEMQLHGSLPAATKGCSGGCLRAHPRITLHFEKGLGVGVATISHNLDPFLQCLKDLGSTLSSPLSFHLRGDRTLADQAESLKSSLGGSHLVQVSAVAIAASQRAYERRLEQEEINKQGKRRKLAQGKAKATNNLLLDVLEICYNHSLPNHLDVADIAWMRLTCKAMANVAAKMSRDRMKQLHLTYSILLENGTNNVSTARSNDHFSVAATRHPLSLLVREHGSTEIGADRENMEASQRSFRRFAPQQSHNFEYTYHNDNQMPHNERHFVRVYLEQEFSVSATTTRTPEGEVLFPIKPVEVARYRIDPRKRQHCMGAVVTNINAVEACNPRNKGSFSLESIAFGFEELVGIFVRRKLPLVRAEFQACSTKQPAQKRYVKALAKAAREAPGNADAFRGLEGW